MKHLCQSPFTLCFFLTHCTTQTSENVLFARCPFYEGASAACVAVVQGRSPHSEQYRSILYKWGAQVHHPEGCSGTHLASGAKQGSVLHPDGFTLCALVKTETGTYTNCWIYSFLLWTSARHERSCPWLGRFE